jgi:Protein of unknown function (DUF2628)
MAVYTVHQPPADHGNPLPDAERIVFVRDGFSFWAFLVAPIWMLWHRMWLVLLGYIIVLAAADAVLFVLGASPIVFSVIGLFISLLLGLEASTLRRFSLQRRGLRNVGVVSGADREDAERRFFGTWLPEHQSGSSRGVLTPQIPVPGASAAAHGSHTPDVVGLFPQPGAHR